MKLIDFGIARAHGRVAHTSPGGLKGKIDYMSPEQASAEDVDHRADVFALGVVLWEALTGKRLFRRETELATMRAIVDEPIPQPSEVAEVPPELDAIVMRALRKRRDARFASAHEMAVALETVRVHARRVQPAAGRRLHEGAVRGRIPAVAQDRDAALDMEVEPPQNAAQGVLAAEPATPGRRWRCGLACRGRTGAARLRSAAERSRSSPSRPRAPEPQSQASNAGVGTSRRDRIWVYGGSDHPGVGLVAGAWLLARPPSWRAQARCRIPSRPTSTPVVIEQVKPVTPADPAPIPTAAPSQVTPPIEATATNRAPPFLSPRPSYQVDCARAGGRVVVEGAVASGQRQVRGRAPPPTARSPPATADRFGRKRQ